MCWVHCGPSRAQPPITLRMSIAAYTTARHGLSRDSGQFRKTHLFTLLGLCPQARPFNAPRCRTCVLAPRYKRLKLTKRKSAKNDATSQVLPRASAVTEHYSVLSAASGDLLRNLRGSSIHAQVMRSKVRRPEPRPIHRDGSDPPPLLVGIFFALSCRPKVLGVSVNASSKTHNVYCRALRGRAAGSACRPTPTWCVCGVPISQHIGQHTPCALPCVRPVLGSATCATCVSVLALHLSLRVRALYMFTAERGLGRQRV